MNDGRVVGGEKVCPIMSKPVGEGQGYYLFEVACRKDCKLLVTGVIHSGTPENKTEMGTFCGLIQEGGVL